MSIRRTIAIFGVLVLATSAEAAYVEVGYDIYPSIDVLDVDAAEADYGAGMVVTQVPFDQLTQVIGLSTFGDFMQTDTGMYRDYVSISAAGTKKLRAYFDRTTAVLNKMEYEINRNKGTTGQGFVDVIDL